MSSPSKGATLSEFPSGIANLATPTTTDEMVSESSPSKNKNVPSPSKEQESQERKDPAFHLQTLALLSFLPGIGPPPQPKKKDVAPPPKESFKEELSTKDSSSKESKEPSSTPENVAIATDEATSKGLTIETGEEPIQGTVVEKEPTTTATAVPSTPVMAEETPTQVIPVQEDTAAATTTTAMNGKSNHSSFPKESTSTPAVVPDRTDKALSPSSPFVVALLTLTPMILAIAAAAFWAGQRSMESSFVDDTDASRSTKTKTLVSPTTGRLLFQTTPPRAADPLPVRITSEGNLYHINWTTAIHRSVRESSSSSSSLPLACMPTAQLAALWNDVAHGTPANVLLEHELEEDAAAVSSSWTLSSVQADGSFVESSSLCVTLSQGRGLLCATFGDDRCALAQQAVQEAEDTVAVTTTSSEETEESGKGSATPSESVWTAHHHRRVFFNMVNQQPLHPDVDDEAARVWSMSTVTVTPPTPPLPATNTGGNAACRASLKSGDEEESPTPEQEVACLSELVTQLQGSMGQSVQKLEHQLSAVLQQQQKVLLQQQRQMDLAAAASSHHSPFGSLASSATASTDESGFWSGVYSFLGFMDLVRVMVWQAATIYVMYLVVVAVVY